MITDGHGTSHHLVVSAPGGIGGCPLMGVTSPWRKLKENVSHIISLRCVNSQSSLRGQWKRSRSRGNPTAVGETQLNMCQNGLQMLLKNFEDVRTEHDF